MKRCYLCLFFSCLLVLTACPAAATSAPTPPFVTPVLVPPAAATTRSIDSPQRILVIGSLFAEDVDTYLNGLVHAANPAAAFEVSSIILPAT